MTLANLPNEPFYFMRHGETDWVEEDTFKSPQIGNKFLNHSGELQVEQAAQTFAAIPGNYAVVASKLNRAMQTAEIVSKKIHASLHPFDNLHEKYFGNYSNLTKEKVLMGETPDDAESDEAFQMRIFKSIPAALNIAEDYTKIIVSHSLVFKHLSLSLTGTQEKIKFGEIVLFSPPNDGMNKWTVTRIA